MNMVMSTPVMGTTDSARTSQVRSLGSVTARLYDPTPPLHDPAPTPPLMPPGANDMPMSPSSQSSARWQFNRSSAAILPASPAHAATVMLPRADRQVRRSMSFAVPPPIHQTVSGDHADVGRLSKDLMDRSTSAVLAARRVGGAGAGGGLGRRVVPLVPVQTASTDCEELAPGGMGAYVQSPTMSSQRAHHAVIHSPLLPSMAKYSSNASQQVHTGRPIPMQVFSPKIGGGASVISSVTHGNIARTTRLSESSSGSRSAAAGDYHQQHSHHGQHSQNSQKPGLAANFSEAQQQKLHPIGRADPMFMRQQMQQMQIQYPATVSSPGGNNYIQQYEADAKVFQMQRHNFASPQQHSSSSKELLAADVLSYQQPQQQPNHQQHQYNFQQIQPRSLDTVVIPRKPRQPQGAVIYENGSNSNSSMANHIQVMVPAGHLSIVYPDSPMSKADTLRRSSIDSLTMRLAQSNLNLTSAGPPASTAANVHAYLVDPDRPNSVNLHATPSNSTTLHSISHLQQQQHQQTYTRRAGNIVLGTGSSNQMYSMQRMADSDSRIAERGRDDYGLPDISSTGSPLMPAGYELGAASRDSIYMQLQHPQNTSGGGGDGWPRGMSRKELTDDELYVEGNGGSPRRSRSLRNTITSLRRRLSKSSRNGSGAGAGAGGNPESSLDALVPQGAGAQ
ncbi:hypothetical protein BX661DRAFT_185381 [Kickxella alabastrina]|uniref:uncharacterized protein n=1 Tax=Kickxella alabastrina TaxID=61397 RepID=UPI00221F90FC|nr:uncharacterized protein BX661DRAFT_185381 [Kickxella alabastrina]KAI7824479.1 hypothetical protein BX661DRAFT_185381 [Kickxella alabastrina]